MDETPDLLEWAEQQSRKQCPPSSTADSTEMRDDRPVVLIDALSQIFRSFYAIRQLNNHRNEPVNALYLMTKLLLQMERDHSGCRGALLFDCGKVAFRLELHPEYKAGRPPMPEALQQQMPRIEEMAEAFGWPRIKVENYEADDLIGAFAVHTSGDVFIVTSDKDLSSLVNERVHLLKPARSGGGFQECGPEEVVRDFGVKPELIPDYLALLGDSVDNIDGVPGIGAKSAAELLNTFGAVDSWYDEEGGFKYPESKFAAKLQGKEPLLRRNLGLTRLKCQLPGEYSDCTLALEKKSPDWQKIANMCADNDFKSLLKELPVAPEEPQREDELF